jgi:hypothetical protein
MNKHSSKRKAAGIGDLPGLRLGRIQNTSVYPVEQGNGAGSDTVLECSFEDAEALVEVIHRDGERRQDSNDIATHAAG